MSDLIKDASGFQKAFKMAEKIFPLGSEKTSFSMWKNDVMDIIEDYELTEKEKKRVVLSCIDDKYRDRCHQVYHNNKNVKIEEFLEKIKRALGFDNISLRSLKKLQNLKIGNKSVNDYNNIFTLLLNDIETDDKPSDKTLLRMYIEGFKGRKLQEYLIIKDLKKLEDAMNFAEKLEKGFLDYDDESLLRPYNNASSSSFKNHNNNYRNKKGDMFDNSKKSPFNNASFNYNKSFNNSKNKNSYNNHQVNNNTNNSSKNNNKIESDIDKLTENFANMRLTVCHRCNQIGHIARFCTNDLSQENKAFLNQKNNSLNY